MVCALDHATERVVPGGHRVAVAGLRDDPTERVPLEPDVRVRVDGPGQPADLVGLEPRDRAIRGPPLHQVAQAVMAELGGLPPRASTFDTNWPAAS